MKQLLLVSLLFLVMMGCRITDTDNNGGTGAELTISNQSASTVFFTLDDASTSPLPEYSIQSFDQMAFFWDLDSNLFSAGNGELVLTYYFAGESPVTVYLQIQPGEIKQYAIGTEQFHLVVENSTSADAWFWLDSQNFTLLHADESVGFTFTDLIGPTALTISYRGDHVFSDDETLNISPGIVEEFIIEADAGAFSLFNNSNDVDIVEVYIAPSDSVYWGPNLLDIPIEELESALWTVAQNNWDMLLVDENNTQLVLYDQLIILDETLERTYSDFILAREQRHLAKTWQYKIEKILKQGTEKKENK